MVAPVSSSTRQIHAAVRAARKTVGCLEGLSRSELIVKIFSLAIELEKTKRAVRAESIPHGLHPHARTIIETVARETHVSVGEILGPSRHMRIAESRHIAIYAMRRLLRLSQQEVAESLQRTDHGTCTNSVKAVIARRETEPAFASYLSRIVSASAEAIGQ